MDEHLYQREAAIIQRQLSGVGGKISEIDSKALVEGRGHLLRGKSRTQKRIVIYYLPVNL
jgi:hypothetical protein